MVSSVEGRDSQACLVTSPGSLTLLFRRAGEPGLEILDPASRWISVPISPLGTATMPFPPILVNIGDVSKETSSQRSSLTILQLKVSTLDGFRKPSFTV